MKGGGPWLVAALLLTSLAVVPDLFVKEAAPGAAGPEEAGDRSGPEGCRPRRYGYTVVRAHPHDPDAFTQGFLHHGGLFYEGTGRYGASTLRTVDPGTGKVLRMAKLPPTVFGEGIALHDGRIIQLTWRAGAGIVFDLDTFRPIRTFRYPGEGWGITHDGARFIMSDGTAELRFWDLSTFRETGRVTVRDRGEPVERLNELEYIKGEVFANVWLTDRIARIDPDSGCVTGWIDLAGLRPSGLRGKGEVLNGIAYDQAGDRLFVTGKNWPAVFEIRPAPAPGAPGDR